MAPPDNSIVATLTVWNTAEGWGVLSHPETPGGGWFHFSNLVDLHSDLLELGQRYRLNHEQVEQDGYAYRATAIRSLTGDAQPDDPNPSVVFGTSFHSTLILTFDGPEESS